MTLGAQGGAVRPLTRSELLELAETSPTTNVVMLGRALGLSEPVIRERVRRGQIAELGIRCLRLGSQWRVVTGDILAFLGIEMDTPGPAPPGPGANTTTTALAKGHHDHDTSAA